MKKLILAGLALLASALAAPALASNCSPFPYTLSNGTTADANQVMGNLNTIMSCANNSLAHSGANSDITSLNTLTTPLSVGQGGTGVANLFGAANSWTGVQTFTLPIVGSVTGSAAKWTAPITFTLTGAVAGTANIDGSGAVSIATTAAPLTYIQVRNQQASGTAGTGESVNTTWTTLVLNTTLSNTVTGASLASNLVTLPAGTYHVHGQVPFSSNNNAGACRVFNSTDSAVLLRGPNVGMVTGSFGSVMLDGVFVLAATKAVAFQCRAQNSWSVSGNLAIGDGTPEVFEDITFLKVG